MILSNHVAMCTQHTHTRGKCSNNEIEVSDNHGNDVTEKQQLGDGNTNNDEYVNKHVNQKS